VKVSAQVLAITPEVFKETITQTPKFAFLVDDSGALLKSSRKRFSRVNLPRSALSQAKVKNRHQKNGPQ
jgi:hypothetical protein